MRVQRWSHSDLQSPYTMVTRSRRKNGVEVRLDFDLHMASAWGTSSHSVARHGVLNSFASPSRAVANCESSHLLSGLRQPAGVKCCSLGLAATEKFPLSSP